MTSVVAASYVLIRNRALLTILSVTADAIRPGCRSHNPLRSEPVIIVMQLDAEDVAHHDSGQPINIPAKATESPRNTEQQALQSLPDELRRHRTQ
jgi:hypothetical protein